MPTTITDVRTIGVTVTDQDRALDFYVGVEWDGVPPMFTFEDPDGNLFYVVEDRS